MYHFRTKTGSYYRRGQPDYGTDISCLPMLNLNGMSKFCLVKHNITLPTILSTRIGVSYKCYAIEIKSIYKDIAKALYKYVPPLARHWFLVAGGNTRLFIAVNTR